MGGNPRQLKQKPTHLTPETSSLVFDRDALRVCMLGKGIVITLLVQNPPVLPCLIIIIFAAIYETKRL